MATTTHQEPIMTTIQAIDMFVERVESYPTDSIVEMRCSVLRDLKTTVNGRDIVAMGVMIAAYDDVLDRRAVAK